MRIFISLLSLTPHINLPAGLMGWAGWSLLLIIEFFLLRKWAALNKSWGDSQKRIFTLLLLSIPFTSLFFGIQFIPKNVGSTLGTGIVNTNYIIPVLFALPWMMTAGFLGPVPAAITGLIAGFFGALWYSHNLYTPLEIALLAILFSSAVCQPGTDSVFRFLKIPMVSALGLILILPIIYSYQYFFLNNQLLIGFQTLLTEEMLWFTVAMAIPILIGGLVSEMFSILRSQLWGSSGQVTRETPWRSLQSRLLYYIIPVALIFVTALLVTNWVSSRKAAQQIVEKQIRISAQNTLDYVSQFLFYGETISKLIASQELMLSDDPDELQVILESSNKQIPFFEFLSLYSESGDFIASQPNSEKSFSLDTEEDREIIQSVAQDQSPKFIVIPEFSGRTSAQLAFFAPVFDENQIVSRVLVGWTNFNTNSVAQPILSGLNDSLEFESISMLIDEQGRYLFHPDPQTVMKPYQGPAAFPEGYFEEISPEGKNELLYFRRAENNPWAVVISIPEIQVQKLALTIAAPSMAMTILIAIISILALLFGGRILTDNLQNLTRIAGRITEGRLNYPLTVNRTDEFGQLSQSFEQMRSSLRDRLEELNRLLIVSQGVASSLEIATTLAPVLEASLSMGGTSARIVLKPDVLPEIYGTPVEPIIIKQGSVSDDFRELDKQILDFMAKQEQLERLVLPDINRPRLFNLSAEKIDPNKSLLVVALRHEKIFFGVLWIGYTERHEFSEEEVRFMITLGGQAAIAIANVRLYQQSEIGRQRLEAILSSSPDPILVTDQHNRLLLANPKAWHVFDLKINAGEYPSIEDIIQDKQLIELMRSDTDETKTLEIKMADGTIFLGLTATVIAKQHPIGRVCIFRDITTFKDLDTLKSEFVSTVSHDLRTPLTLMRGYATMLEMVGDLNEQQINFVQKIISGVESMTRLVNNLLDLSRIEAGIALKTEPIPPKEIVDNVLSGLKLQAIQKRIDLKSEIPEDIVPVIEADKALLQQALHNLVDNAIKFTRGDGQVTVGVFTRGKNIRFKVIDNGIGISPMDQKHLFGKFHQLTDQSSEVHHGSGLGLAIVKSIAIRHKGKVWAESQLGKGSTFYLEIPVNQPTEKLEK